jgi:hypothetical protein
VLDCLLHKHMITLNWATPLEIGHIRFFIIVICIDFCYVDGSRLINGYRIELLVA